MMFLWICSNLCVYLSLVSFIVVPMFICICEEMQMYMIQICHNINVVLSKAAQLIWIFAQKVWPENSPRIVYIKQKVLKD